MVLDDIQIKALAVAEPDDSIQLMRKQAEKLRRNYYNENLQQYLSQINEYENDRQFALRKKFAIGNQDRVEDLLRPVDNVFVAKGGSREIPKEKQLAIEQLNNVRNGMNIRQYMADVFFEQLIVNPGGLAFLERIEEQQAMVTIKSIAKIKNYKLNGIVPDYVFLEPDGFDEEGKQLNEDETVSFLWAYDGANTYRVKIRLDEKETQSVTYTTTPHNMNVVPAIVYSPIMDTRDRTQVSPIWKQVKRLDLISVDDSVKQIYQFIHGFPKYWQYITECPVCKGTRYVDGVLCSRCKGTGVNINKDVTDGIFLKPPKNEEDGIKIAPDIAGYVQPDLETWREMRVEIDDKYEKVFYSHWGTNYQREGNETATGRFIDIQPVNNKLNKYADWLENAEKHLTDLIIRFYYPTSFKPCNINYGRRFMIETPDQIWTKYKDSRLSSPDHVLDLLLQQYYESEFRKNEMMLNVMVKLMKLEPYVHKTVDEVLGWALSDEDKKRKILFSEWVKMLGYEYVHATDLTRLQTEFDTFINSKTNGTES